MAKFQRDGAGDLIMYWWPWGLPVANDDAAARAMSEIWKRHRFLGHWERDNFRVVTIWFGNDDSAGNDEIRPRIFGTLTTGPDVSDEVTYQSWSEAIAGHVLAILKVLER